MRRVTWIASLSVVGTVLAVVACDSDTGRRTRSTAAGTDESQATPGEDDTGEHGPPNPSGTFEGEARGGMIPLPAAGNDPPVDFDAGGGVTTDTRCCNVTLSIADATNNETSATVVGDTDPLLGRGVTLTYGSGRWSANVCLPLNRTIRYVFDFGAVPGDDAGARDQRAASDAPTGNDGLGFRYNVYAPVSDCALIDAGQGMSH